MIICEFCLHRLGQDSCDLGLNIPKTMRCKEFTPGMEKFCAKPEDFVDADQIVQIAKFFGLEKTELKKVKVIAERGTVDQPGEVA